MNFVLLIIEVVISYALLIFVYKKYEDEGLHIWMVIALILSSLMCIKSIEINSVNISLGLGISSSIYIANNILVQKKGAKYINNSIIMLIVFSTIFICLLLLSSLIISSEYKNITNLIYDNIVLLNIKYVVANIISIIIGIYINDYIYYELRKIKNKIWISNILSSFIFNFVEVVIFVFITKFMNVSLYIAMMTVVMRYIIKLIMLIIGTSVIYTVNSFRERL